MKDIVAEGDEMIEEDADDEVRDAGLIAVAQRAYQRLMRGRGRQRLCGRSHIQIGNCNPFRTV